MVKESKDFEVTRLVKDKKSEDFIVKSKKFNDEKSEVEQLIKK